MNLGFDLGGTQIKAGLVDENGRVTNMLRAPTPANLPDFQAVLQRITRELVAEQDISGVGFASKGIIDFESTRVIANPGPTDFLEHHTLAGLIESVLPQGCKVRGDNDARAALAGEVAYGAARGHKDVLFFTLGTGVGGGILANGQIVRGAGGIAGHLGHVSVNPNGAACLCGGRGCLETVFSARAIESASDEVIHRGVDTKLRQVATRPPSCADVFALAREGDEIAKQILHRAIEALGAAIAGLIHAFDPEVIILGGQIAEAGEFLFVPLQKEITWRTAKFIRRSITLKRAEVTDGIVGAAALLR